jgi:5-methylcytosine-specific restriction endonuclease McrA
VGEPPEGTGKPVHPDAGPQLVTGDVSVESVLRLLEAQQYRCSLTGRSLTPQNAALDHIVPVRFGGEHVIENAQVLHKDVNRAKGSLTNEEFIGMCHEVVRWSDRQKQAQGGAA